MMNQHSLILRSAARQRVSKDGNEHPLYGSSFETLKLLSPRCGETAGYAMLLRMR